MRIAALPDEAESPSQDGAGPRGGVVPKSNRWFQLFAVTRIAATALAAGLVAAQANHDRWLIPLAAGYAGVSLLAAIRWPTLQRLPAAWAADTLIPLAFVLLDSEQWRSPFYLLALTSLILPATALSYRRAVAWGLGFTAAYFAVALIAGIDWQSFDENGRLESFATHLTVPMLIVVALAYSGELLRRLEGERLRSEELAREAERRRMALESARSTLAGQEAERQRLARELHDEIGQTLTALLLQLGRAAKEASPDVVQRLGDAQEAARASIGEVQRIVRELRPEALEDLGLATALTVLANRVQEHTGLRIVRRLEHDLPALSRDEELVAYRVAQEALTNVVRHAEASRAELRLERTRDGVSLSVTDDGRGMDGANAGTGIRGMQERALLIGARLAIDSSESGGSEVRLTFPREAGG
jgi:signal transduction histidine kinase